MRRNVSSSRIQRHLYGLRYDHIIGSRLSTKYCDILFFQLCKARSSISTTNQQLTDYDTENSQLKMKLTHLEIDFKEKFLELEEMRNVMEQNNIEHSTLVTEKDRMIKSLQERMVGDNSGDAALNSHLELAELTSSSGSGGLQAVITDLRSVEAGLRGCEDNEELRAKVSGAAAMLRSLTMVVEHDQSMVRAISEDNILDIDEDGATMTGTGDISIEEEESLLESQLVELTEKLDRMETEMVIVSEESKNLQQALEIRESTILDQVTGDLEADVSPITRFTQTWGFLLHSCTAL